MWLTLSHTACLAVDGFARRPLVAAKPPFGLANRLDDYNPGTLSEDPATSRAAAALWSISRKQVEFLMNAYTEIQGFRRRRDKQADADDIEDT
jgi:hypothetical protein